LHFNPQDYFPDGQLEGLTAIWAVNLNIMVMLGTAWIARRSLGAWQVWLASFLHALLVEGLWLAGGMDRALVVPSLGSMLFLPAMIFVLANRQCIPGLRRGQMSRDERSRWLVSRGFEHGSVPRRMIAKRR
jgi:hypothetical protein